MQLPVSALSMDYAREANRIAKFVRKTVDSAGARGVVVGISGGVDSAVVGALCVRAVGSARVYGLLMPSRHTPERELLDARALVRSWGIRADEVLIGDIAEQVRSAARVNGTKIARANVEARGRMTLLYYYANSMGYLVAGTGDRSEVLLGYFTKWGDGGVDFLPVAHLYKTQVRRLGAYLGLPENIVNKPASPGLWPGHTAAQELPADYVKLDPLLHFLFDLRLPPKKAAARAGVSASLANEVVEMHMRTAHKRSMPPSMARR